MTISGPTSIIITPPITFYHTRLYLRSCMPKSRDSHDAIVEKSAPSSGAKKAPPRPPEPPRSRQTPTCHRSAKPIFRMRPASLPPLIIPRQRCPKPIFLASYLEHPLKQPVFNKPIPQMQAHAKPLPQLPSQPPQPQPIPIAKSDPNWDVDDIVALFQFHHPCLLPPTPISNRHSVALTLNRSGSCPLPGSLRRTPANRSRKYSTRRHTDIGSRNTRTTPPPESESETPSLFFVPSPPPPYYEQDAFQPRFDSDSVNWRQPQLRHTTIAAPSPPPTPAIVEEIRVHLDGMLNASPIVKEVGATLDGMLLDVEEEWDDGYYTFQSRVGVDDVPVDNGTLEAFGEREREALKELWDVVDGLLGPGPALGEYGGVGGATGVGAVMGRAEGVVI